MENSQPSRAERLAEFVRRLNAAPRAQSFAEAYQQIVDILNAVEDELTAIPFNPEAATSLHQADGRMYPPLRDSERSVPDYPSVKRLRSRGHNTFIGVNGSVEIADLRTGHVLL